jgi:hypothetical protein
MKPQMGHRNPSIRTTSTWMIQPKPLGFRSLQPKASRTTSKRSFSEVEQQPFTQRTRSGDSTSIQELVESLSFSTDDWSIRGMRYRLASNTLWDRTLCLSMMHWMPKWAPMVTFTLICSCESRKPWFSGIAYIVGFWFQNWRLIFSKGACIAWAWQSL